MSSRRERRRKASAGAGKSKWVIRGIVGVFAAAMLVMGGGYFWLGRWLHGEGFRKMLSEEAGKATQTRAEFGIFDWSGTLVRTGSFQAEGDALVKRVEAKDMSVDIGVAAAWHGVLKVDEARVRSIEVELDSTAPARESEESPSDSQVAQQPKKEHWYDRFVPHELELKQLRVERSDARIATKSGPMTIKGTAWKVEPDQQKGSYLAQATGGEVKLPGDWAPPMSLGMARLRYADDTLFLTDADFQVYQSGQLSLDGEMPLKGRGYTFNGDLRDVNCAEVLPETWKKRVEGRFRTTFEVTDPAGRPQVDGKLELSDAVVTALPFLDTLAAYADTSRFRRIALQKATCSYTWDDGNLDLRNISMSSEGLVRLQGDLKISKEGQLDGIFRLGLVPGVLSTIPGAETDVFLPGEGQLLWTTLHITGTLDHPQEDLSDRLILAAGERMFEYIPETGEKMLKFSHGVLQKNLPQALEKGADLAGSAVEKGGQILGQGKEVLGHGKEILGEGKEVLKGAKGAVKDVGDLLDIFGGNDNDPPPPLPKDPPSPPGNGGH